MLNGKVVSEPLAKSPVLQPSTVLSAGIVVTTGSTVSSTVIALPPIVLLPQASVIMYPLITTMGHTGTLITSAYSIVKLQASTIFVKPSDAKSAGSIFVSVVEKGCNPFVAISVSSQPSTAIVAGKVAVGSIVSSIVII